MVNSVQRASSNNSAPFASSISWIDFGPNFQLSNGQSKSVTNVSPEGYTISFTVTFHIDNPISLGTQVYLQAFPVPVLGFKQVPFGNRGYTGIHGYIALYQSTQTQPNISTNSTIIISDISVKSENCTNNLSSFMMIAADAEATNANEIWQGITNGSNWIMIDNIPAFTGNFTQGPTISGVGTKIVTETGQTPSSLSAITAGVYATISPSNLTFILTTNGSREAVALGILFNSFPSPDNPSNNSTTICVSPNETKCYTFNPDCILAPTDNCICKSNTKFQNNNHHICIQLVCNDFKTVIPITSTFTGNLGTYSIIDDTICLTTNSNICSSNFDELNFIIKYNNYLYHETLIFVYNCTN